MIKTQLRQQMLVNDTPNQQKRETVLNIISYVLDEDPHEDEYDDKYCTNKGNDKEN